MIRNNSKLFLKIMCQLEINYCSHKCPWCTIDLVNISYWGMSGNFQYLFRAELIPGMNTSGIFLESQKWCSWHQIEIYKWAALLPTRVPQPKSVGWQNFTTARGVLVGALKVGAHYDHDNGERLSLQTYNKNLIQFFHPLFIIVYATFTEF